jgi:hypothetical protein
VRWGLIAVVLAACQSGRPGAPCEFQQTVQEPLMTGSTTLTLTYQDVGPRTSLIADRSNCTEACVWANWEKPANAQPTDPVVGTCASSCADGGVCGPTAACEPVFFGGAQHEVCIDITFLLGDAG